MWVKSAEYIENTGNIAVTYTKYVPGTGWNYHTEFFGSSPSGGWTHLEFDQSSTTTLCEFLNAMVVKDITIKRRIAKLALDHALESERYSDIIAHISLLDPTFEPPVFNHRARWQRELERDIATNTSWAVISSCYNEKNLERYSRTLILF